MSPPERPDDDLSLPELTADETEILNRLVADSEPDDGLTLPGLDESLLAAYLRGDASPDDAKMIRRALEDSSALRKEMIYLAGLRDPEVQARFDRQPVAAVLAFDAPVLRATAAPADHCVAPPPRVRRPPTITPGFLWGALAVAAALVFLVFYLQLSQVAVWSAESPLVADQFESDVLRGGGAGGFPEPADPSEAALQAFLEAVRWDGTEFRVLPVAAESPAAPSHGVTVHVKGAPDYTASVPNGAEEMQAWLLALPSLARYRTTLQRGDLDLSWPATGDIRAAMTITYRLDGRFLATRVKELARQ